MNILCTGDLTAYFHPSQKRAYESIYDDIDGLKYYFPSLGNHDIEHPGGAMYGGDEWAGGVRFFCLHVTIFWRAIAFFGLYNSFGF